MDILEFGIGAYDGQSSLPAYSEITTEEDEC